MNHRTTPRRMSLGAVALCAGALVAATACTRTADKPGDSAVSQAPDTSAQGGAPASAQSLGGYPGESGIAALDAYLAKLDFNINYADRDSTAFIEYQCKTGDACAPGNVRFLVIAEKGAFSVDWPDALNSTKNKGYVTAVYWNLDRVEVKSLNLAADSSMYQWVGPIAPGGVVGIEVFSVYNGAVQVASKTQKWTTCTLNGERTKSAAKKNPGHTTCVNMTAPGPQLPVGAANSLFPDDLWLSCKGGCCQAPQ